MSDAGWWVFHGQRDKYVTLGMVGIMFGTSTLDMLCDWINLSHLQNVNYWHGMVVGPPPHSAITALLMFNIFGVLVYLIEMFNTFTILTNNRRMRLPVVVEQGITLLLLEIPQAAINLSIVTCRLHHVASSQVASGVFSILKCAVRLYMYGWFREMEYGVKAKSTFTTTLKIALYVTCTMIWLMLLMTELFMWQSPWQNFEGLTALGSSSWIQGISIVLLHRQLWEKPDNFTLDTYLKNQAIPLETPWLVKDIDSIISDPEMEATVMYPCRKNATDLPPMCKHAPEIKYRFKYHMPSSNKPFGSIHYNYAGMGNDRACIRSQQVMRGNWTLAFLSLESLTQERGNLTIIGHAPWRGVCTVPTPHYNPELTVC